MSAKHPHDEYIRGWLDGRAVQFDCERELTGVWVDIPPPDDCTCLPLFSRAFRFRFKPETIRYRVMLVFDDGSKQVRCCHPSRYEAVEKSPNYLIRWLGDEQEVEVTP